MTNLSFCLKSVPLSLCKDRLLIIWELYLYDWEFTRWSICCNPHLQGGNAFTTLTVRFTNPLSLPHGFCLPTYAAQTYVLWLGYYTNCTVNVLICSQSYVWSVNQVNVLQSLWQCHMTNSSWTSSQVEKGGLSVC